jgi:small subunit ribosomal protein S17
MNLVTTKKTGRKTLTGKVINNKMDKTIIVAISRLIKHPLYEKYIRKTTKVMAHDEKKECDVGDIVLIKEVRPISKKKHWMLVKIIKKNKEEKIELKEDVLEENSRSDKNDTGTN